MARIIGFNPEAKAIPASSVVRFSQNELVNDGVVAFVIGMEGNGGLLTTTGLYRIRVKAGGDQIADWDIAALRSYCERFGPKHYQYSTAGTNIIVPFFLLEQVNEAIADSCQFPLGQAPTIELYFGSGGDGTGTVQIGWIRTTHAARTFPRVSNTAMNVAASTSNAHHTLTQRGTLRAIAVNDNGLDRLVVTLNGGTRWVHTQGDGTAGISLFMASQQWQGITSSNGILWLPEGAGVEIGRGRPSQIELDTGVGWGGVTNAVTVMTLHPQPGGAAKAG